MIDFQNLSQFQSNQSFMEKVENEDMKKLLSTLSEGLPPPENQLNLNFFQDNNGIPKKKKKSKTKCSNTKVKTRNIFRNVSYRRYKPEGVEKVNFVVDAFSFLTQNLNLTCLDRKLETALERDYVKMIWDTCMPGKFSKFIYPKENFIDLCQPHITYQKANNIVLKFIEEDLQNFELLQATLREHLRII